MVEHNPDTIEVAGSNPARFTKKTFGVLETLIYLCYIEKNKQNDNQYGF